MRSMMELKTFYDKLYTELKKKNNFSSHLKTNRVREDDKHYIAPVFFLSFSLFALAGFSLLLMD